ncbi:TPA: hypothetical protein N0F65_010537 [Lagenidium giganteum]|uniref:Succinate dehydrogenase assembly factor 4, mitochondrial n=1 Tax=Lagenidium giganteum TaxID=4803 RepID=A0AAV2ZBE9_9STRA|nr:TPA: hypothetical protein N0F65_010537 [Lagenidium giganteum]
MASKMARRALCTWQQEASTVRRVIGNAHVPQRRWIASTTVQMHGAHDHDDHDLVKVSASKKSVDVVHSSLDDDDDDDDEDMVQVMDDSPLGIEWGGPKRGGKFKEPTRFGDWERKGRCSDF